MKWARNIQMSSLSVSSGITKWFPTLDPTLLTPYISWALNFVTHTNYLHESTKAQKIGVG